MPESFGQILRSAARVSGQYSPGALLDRPPFLEPLHMNRSGLAGRHLGVGWVNILCRLVRCSCCGTDRFASATGK
jgi:hypothetical protein